VPAADGGAEPLARQATRRAPTLDSFDAALRPALLASSHRLDHALPDLNAGLDQLADLSGLKLAA
jgi:hypothetical protein